MFDEDVGNQKAGEDEEKVDAHPQHLDVERVVNKYCDDCNRANAVQLNNTL
jgi:hypothetical protein